MSGCFKRLRKAAHSGYQNNVVTSPEKMLLMYDSTFMDLVWMFLGHRDRTLHFLYLMV